MGNAVLILGAGLVGSSLGLALTRAGYDVRLWDIAPSHAVVAASLGAGAVADEETDNPDIVVVATPPDAIPSLVAEVLEKFPTSARSRLRSSPRCAASHPSTSATWVRTPWPARSSPAR